MSDAQSMYEDLSTRKVNHDWHERPDVIGSNRSALTYYERRWLDAIQGSRSRFASKWYLSTQASLTTPKPLTTCTTVSESSFGTITRPTSAQQTNFNKLRRHKVDLPPEAILVIVSQIRYNN